MEKHELNRFPEMLPCEFDMLVEDMKMNGYDSTKPIYTYNGKIIDGWNRWKACKIANVTPIFEDFSGNDFDIISFIIRSNKRRNLTSSQWATIAFDYEPIIEEIRNETERMRREKQAESIANAPRQDGKFSTVCNNSLLQTERNPNENSTATQIATMFSTNRDYINKAGKLKEEAPYLFEEVKVGNISINAAFDEAFNSHIIKPDPPINKPHVSHNSGENEWYTPPEIIESARLVMGKIDLDPASSEIANEYIGANLIYTIDDNGLNKDWHGNVWLNPPYSQPEIVHFSDAVARNRNNYECCIVLVNNATETNWFQNMLVISDAVCFIKGRLKFIDMDGCPSGAPLQGQALLYFGKNIQTFIDEFSKYGICLTKPTGEK